MISKMAGIFTGLPKALITSLLRGCNIGEDSEIKPANKITNAELEKNVFFGKFGGKVVIVVKKGPQFTIVPKCTQTYCNWKDRDGLYHKFRSLGALQGNMEHELKKEKILSENDTLERLDWYMAKPINMSSLSRNRKQTSRETEQEDLKPKIEISTFKQWAFRQLKVVRSEFDIKSKKALDEFFLTLENAMSSFTQEPVGVKYDSEEGKEIYRKYYESKEKIRNKYQEAKNIIERYRKISSHLQDITVTLERIFLDFFSDETEKNVSLEKAKDFKKTLLDALNENATW